MSLERRAAIASSVVALLLLAAACSRGGGGSRGAEVAALRIRPGDRDEIRYAKQTWQSVCATCHGAAGRGDGPAGRALNPRPQSFHDADWQTSVDDDHIRRIILEGGEAVGKSALMPANPDLSDKPEAVAFLVDVVRSFGQ